MKHFLQGRARNTILVSMAAIALSATPLMANAAQDNSSNFATNRTDFRDESIYFVITTRFFDGDEGNNVLCWDNQTEQIRTKDPAWRGDFEGLIDRLDYIKALGFTAIWITPVVQNASGYDYHGYHAMDFSHVDCRYQGVDGKYAGKTGDEMFQELIKQAHAKGIKIVLDIVLNHTGNFGESYLMPEFTRDQDIRNQASINDCMVPNYDLLPSDYLDNVSTQYQRRLALMKNTDGENHDTKNYWHHVASSWNWDEPTRWWGQIAGDCVDLNTENPAVDDYLVKCYGKFIRMGVDGFRIDTSGHIAPLTFNSAFIPEFQKIANETESQNNRKMNGIVSPFYMYGEVCARFGGVTYRDQPILSPYYYTWKSSDAIVSEWKQYDASWWASQTVKEGAPILGNMTTCTNDDASKGTSNNAWLQNGRYHTPDYSQSSGFNVIDFPVHYNFNNVGSVWGMTDEDNKYNDATWNVVYVDSHDYGPQPSDNIRFSGGTNQWAENLTWMFLFRGIPCLYYGSEVEFQKGQVIDNGPNGPLSNTGRAYFGQNLAGTVTASDFGQFTATGQVEKTLNHPLAKHIERLNRIRQAVPALRKGQYAKQSSTSGWAWSKEYKEGNVDSYVCVAQQAGTATFNNIPNGTYVDCVTGDSKTVSNGTLTISCPTNQGNARIYVLNGPGKIGEDTPFLYGSVPGSADTSSLATDEGAEEWIGPGNAVGQAGLAFTGGGSSFTSESETIKVSLINSTKGWYSINGGEKVNVTGDTSFTIGEGDPTGTSYTVTWGATPNDGSAEKTGSVTYRKVGAYTPSVSANEKSVFYETDATSVSIWVWNDSKNFTGGVWDHKPNMDYMGVNADGKKIYKWTYDGTESSMPTKVIFVPAGANQSGDLDYKNHGYYIDGTLDHVVGSSSADDDDKDKDDTDNKPDKTITLHAYFVNNAGWSTVKAWVWQNSNESNNYCGGNWPGADCTKLSFKGDNGEDIYEWTYTGTNSAVDDMMIIFDNGNSGSGNQTDNYTFTNGAFYNATMQNIAVPSSMKTVTGISAVNKANHSSRCIVYNLRGQKVADVNSITDVEYILRPGIYIANGKKFVIR